MTTPEPDISHGMGMEDYCLGRPNRADQASDPAAYRAGWDEAGSEQARQALAAEQAH